MATPNPSPETSKNSISKIIESLKAKVKDKSRENLSQLDESVAFGKIGDLIRTLFDEDLNNDHEEAEAAIAKALNEVAGTNTDVQKWLITEFKNRFGLNLRVVEDKFEIGDAEVDNLEQEDFTIPPKLRDVLTNILSPENLKDPAYTFEKFKANLESAKTLVGDSTVFSFFGEQVFQQLGISLQGGTFAEKTDELLKNSKLKETFDALKQNALDAAKNLNDKEKALGMNLTDNQQNCLNILPDLDVEALLDSIKNSEALKGKGDKEVMNAFREAFAGKVYNAIKEWYDSNLPKKKTKTPASDSKMENMAGNMKENVQVVREQGAKFLAGLPPVVTQFVSEEQLLVLEKNWKAGKAFDFSLEALKEDINERLGKPEDLTEEKLRSGFNNKLEKIENSAEADFMIAKMETVSPGYRESDWATKYESYVQETGPAAMDFPDWIVGQNVSFGERLGAMLRDLLGPLIEMFKELMGDKIKEEPTLTSKKIDAYKKQAKEYKEKEQTKTEQDKKIEALINDSEINWENIKIKGLDYAADGKPTVEGVRRILGDDFENDLADLKDIATSDKNGVSLALNKGLEFSTLQNLDNFAVDGVTIEPVKGSGNGKFDKLVFKKSGQADQEVVFDKKDDDTELNTILEGFEVGKSEKKIDEILSKISKESDVPIDNLKEILDMKKSEYDDFFGAKLAFTIGGADKGDFANWLKGKGKDFFNSDKETLREWIDNQ